MEVINNRAWRMARWAGTLGFVLVVLGTAAAAAQEPPASAPAPTTATLVVEISGFRSDLGQAKVTLFNSPSGYPAKQQQAFRQASNLPIKERQVTVTFEGLTPGVYAVAVYHDENGNGILDTNFLGIPQEPIGVSRDARGSMGPPRFQDASLTLPVGLTTTRIRIKNRLK